MSAALARTDDTARLAGLLRTRLGEAVVAALEDEFAASKHGAFLDFLLARGVLSTAQAHTVRAVLKGYLNVPADSLLADLRWAPGQSEASKQTLHGAAPLPERATPLPVGEFRSTLTPAPRADSLASVVGRLSDSGVVTAPREASTAREPPALVAPPPSSSPLGRGSPHFGEPSSPSSVHPLAAPQPGGPSPAARPSAPSSAQSVAAALVAGSVSQQRPSSPSSVQPVGGSALLARPSAPSSAQSVAANFPGGSAARPSAPGPGSSASGASILGAPGLTPAPPAPWPPPRPSSPFAAPVTGAFSSSVMPKPSVGARPVPPSDGAAPPPVRPSSPEFARLPRPSPGGSMSLAALADARRAQPEPAPPPSAPIPLTTPAVTLRAGQSLGRYQLQELLGEGSTALTFRSFHEALQIPVALKVYRPTDRVAQDTLRERFVREARVLARLDHSHIVRVLDVDEAQGLPFIVFEYVGAMSMDELVRATGHLGVSRTLRIGRDVASALGAAAEHGLLHRDVKPANILVRKDGLVKLADFGLAHSQHGAHEGGGLVYGTPAFMSPEAITTPGSVDVRSDMYSLGCTLFFALSGQAPYERASPIETMRAQVSEPTPSLRDVPQPVEALVRRLLAKSAAERFATWPEVVAAFEALSQVDTVTPKPGEPMASAGRGLSTIARKMSELFKGR
ncbi:MAG: protein kinase [Myxococcaceae bacterium]|nr:protein kinase [Myxococcaceae bacterium]